MEIAWNDGDEAEGVLCIGKISDAEGKRVAAIAVTAFRATGSVKVDGERKWFLEPLELCLVEDAGDDLKFTAVWRDDGIGPYADKRKASKQKAFTETVAEFGTDANVESYGSLVSDFFENRLIELKDDMIMDFDAPISMPIRDKGRGTIRPVQYKYEYVSERPRREKGIWQFVATDASKRDEDERLSQMERIVRMGQLMLDKTTRSRKRFSHLN